MDCPHCPEYAIVYIGITMYHYRLCNDACSVTTVLVSLIEEKKDIFQRLRPIYAYLCFLSQ